MKIALLVATVLFMSTTLAYSAEEIPFQNELGVCKSLMDIYSFNFAILGAMAKGDAPYNSAKATDAAGNLVAAASMRNYAMWPSGSSFDAAGLENETRANAKIWTQLPKFEQGQQALTDALIVGLADSQE